MKKLYRYLSVVVLFGLVIFMYSFSNQRNEKRSRGDINIKIINDREVFVTPGMVNNLLKKYNLKVEPDAKDSLDLEELEGLLNKNGMIEKAEVFQTITKNIGIIVKQKEPVARVIGDPSFYIDKTGGTMPLSDHYTSRVLLVSQVDSTQVRDLFPLLEAIDKDAFFKHLIMGVYREKGKDYFLKLRKKNFTVNFGEITEIDRKLQNFKIFYQKAETENKLDEFAQVNLKYINQVVCTKKE